LVRGIEVAVIGTERSPLLTPHPTQLQIGLTYRKLFDLESGPVIPQASMDSFIQAIIKLQNLGRSTETAVSYPKPTKARHAVAAE